MPQWKVVIEKLELFLQLIPVKNASLGYKCANFMVVFFLFSLCLLEHFYDLLRLKFICSLKMLL